MFDLIERLKVSHLDWCEKHAPGCDPAEIPSVMAEAAAELTRLRAKVDLFERALEDIADGMGETKLVEIGRFAPVVARIALSAYEGEKG